jgi:hypothetical protein
VFVGRVRRACLPDAFAGRPPCPPSHASARTCGPPGLDALAALWPELPALVGDDWPQVQAALEGHLQQLEREPSQAALVRGYIRQALCAYPAAQARLNHLLAPEVELPAARLFQLPAATCAPMPRASTAS